MYSLMQLPPKRSGSGLGMKEDGMTDAIKVKLKQDTAGIGHDFGKEFTDHWWDNVFNSAANNITVVNSQDGVKVEAKTTKKRKKDGGKNGMVYGGFIQSSTTITNGVEVTVDSPQLSDSESASVVANAARGARHGHHLGGKLSRIQQQEQHIPGYIKKHKHSEPDQTSSTRDDTDGCDIEVKKTKKKKRKRDRDNCDS